jgi:nitroreductase
MTVSEAIRSRQSVRSYLDKPVQQDTLDELFEAARLAPSAGNRQEWRFVAVTDPEMRMKLARAAAGQAFVGEAPCVIAACAETDGHAMRCGQLCYPIDVAIAIDHMTLRAVELGLGTCWIGAFSEDEVKKLLGIPEPVRVVELLTVGYPRDARVREKSRLEKEKIAFYGTWGKVSP